MTGVIELLYNEQAEPGHCGSCCWFKRRDNHDGMGCCYIPLPPFIVLKPQPEEADTAVNNRTLKDTDQCAFYKPADIIFKQTSAWKAGEKKQ